MNSPIMQKLTQRAGEGWHFGLPAGTEAAFVSSAEQSSSQTNPAL